ncbi:hypothetical protein BHM03_00019925 [Ensete ventricosum]|nr:hypothetical protein BHM03_00019925 [Ensete ventricosum]
MKRRGGAYVFLLHFDYVVEEILQNANERRGTDSKADEQKNVVLLVVLSWSTVRPVYQKLGQAAIQGMRAPLRITVKRHG